MKTKVVLITGCSSGIGKALAEEFNKCGFRVIATARSLDSMTGLRGQGVITYPLDVIHDDEIDRVITGVLDKEQKIDILVNNAGYGLMGPTIEMPKEELNRQFLTNVFAPVVLAQKVAPIMKNQGSGLIINIGSISGLVTTPFSGAYCASKAALHALSDALRMELAPFGINVISVQPGSIKSKFGDTAGSISSGLLKKDSWYTSIEDAIKMRAKSSQIGATSAEDFAEKLVSIVSANKMPAIVRIGKKSTFLPLLKKLLPLRILDYTLQLHKKVRKEEVKNLRSPME